VYAKGGKELNKKRSGSSLLTNNPSKRSSATSWRRNHAFPLRKSLQCYCIWDSTGL